MSLARVAALRRRLTLLLRPYLYPITTQQRTGADIRTSDPMRNRAKNALTRLSHSLTYQVRTAQGKRSGFDFTAEDRAVEEKRGKPRARLEDSVGEGVGAGGQTKLNFAPVVV